MAKLTSDVQNLLQGRKTYIVAIAAVILGVLQGFEWFTLPGWAWPVLYGAGLGSMRIGVSTVAKIIKDGTKK